MVTLFETSTAGHPTTSAKNIDTMMSELRPGAGQPVISVPVTGETTIDASSPVNFLHRAVERMNEPLWGTLAASLTVPDELRKKQSSELDAAVVSLRPPDLGL